MTTGGRPATGGNSGAAGCPLEPVENTLAHCPDFVTGRETQGSTCDFEATCEALGCGETWSDFDSNGCLRPTCRSSDDCGADQRCVPAVLAGELGCHSSVFERCEPDCSYCSCNASADCIGAAFCHPSVDFPPSNDCDIQDASCDDLEELELMLSIYDYEDYAGDTALALEACAEAISGPLADCHGSAGAGGN